MGTTYIDVSQYNGKIAWNKIKADGVFIRAAYRGYSAGVIKQDAMLEDNLKGAIENKIPVGMYFMSQAISESEAYAEADFCLQIAKKNNVELPIIFDCEYSGEKNYNGRADHLTKDQRTAIVVKFCETIKAGGHIPGVYSSTSWYSSQLQPTKLKNYMIWCAQYNTECKLKVLKWHLWQYTSKGKMEGIEKFVDMSKTSDNENLIKTLKSECPNLFTTASGSTPKADDNKIIIKDEVMSFSKAEDANKRLWLDDKTPTNFKVYEFACHNKTDTIKIDGRLVKVLQKIREHFGVPVSITSAYRTQAYNMKVGGAKNSYHVKGMAADITVSGISNREVAKYAAQITNGVGLYNYTGGFVHVDVRGAKYLWQQDSKNTKYYTVAGFNENKNVRPVLRYNDRGSWVVTLQGILKIDQDGVFGPKTEAAVRQYQKNHGLKVDGVVGAATWSSLLK